MTSCFLKVTTLSVLLHTTVSQKLYFGCNSNCWSLNISVLISGFFFFRQYVSVDLFLNAPYRFFFLSTDMFYKHLFRCSFSLWLFLSLLSTSSILPCCLLLPPSSIKSQPGQAKMNEEVWVEKGMWGKQRAQALQYQDSGGEFTVTDFDGIDKMLSASS